MDQTSLRALSPLDGRYSRITQPLAIIFSEASFINFRVQIELLYLEALSKAKVIRSLTDKEKQLLLQWQKPSTKAEERVKELEQTTHHDVKAIEYYLAEKFQTTTLADCIPYIHLGLTSEDVNNLAYRLMITRAQRELFIPKLRQILANLAQLSLAHCNLPMLARTHGQPAIPTTLGKELSVFAMRLLEQLKQLESHHLTGKLNGAVGSFQALSVIQPQIDWISFSQKFVTSLGLKPNLHTTQINPADDLIGLFNLYHLINSILIDLDQDIWRYISDNWLVQVGKDQTVGSSTMPQKINPIEFENSEGNLTLANGLIETINRKLPISRLQRDLSDSTINRNLGSILGYCLIGYSSLDRGLRSIQPNPDQIEHDLNHNYSILSEALQTQLRFQQEPQAYQQIAKLVKGQVLTQANWHKLVQTTGAPLSALTPQTYIGLAVKLTKLAVKDIQQYLKRRVQ